MKWCNDVVFLHWGHWAFPHTCVDWKKEKERCVSELDLKFHESLLSAPFLAPSLRQCDFTARWAERSGMSCLWWSACLKPSSCAAAAPTLADVEFTSSTCVSYPLSAKHTVDSKLLKPGCISVVFFFFALVSRMSTALRPCPKFMSSKCSSCSEWTQALVQSLLVQLVSLLEYQPG